MAMQDLHSIAESNPNLLAYTTLHTARERCGVSALPAVAPSPPGRALRELPDDVGLQLHWHEDDLTIARLGCRISHAESTSALAAITLLSQPLLLRCADLREDNIPDQYRRPTVGDVTHDLDDVSRSVTTNCSTRAAEVPQRPPRSRSRSLRMKKEKSTAGRKKGCMRNKSKAEENIRAARAPAQGGRCMYAPKNAIYAPHNASRPAPFSTTPLPRLLAEPLKQKMQKREASKEGVWAEKSRIYVPEKTMRTRNKHRQVAKRGVCLQHASPPPEPESKHKRRRKAERKGRMYARQNAPRKERSRNNNKKLQKPTCANTPPPARSSQSSAPRIPRSSPLCYSGSPRSTRILCCCCPRHSHMPRKEDWRKTSTPASQNMLSTHTFRVHPRLEVGPEEGSGWGDRVRGACTTGGWGWRDQVSSWDWTGGKKGEM
ncbi:hypothetical protein B0H14DRAFT_3738407 [Mycena olivaceomarginata]|nr:hypothetical protein B0H14DRAFT_3738407 [Mycena olivaceomarginata]